MITDSKICVDAFQEGEDHCRTCANSDLWLELFSLLHERNVMLQLQWSKGHADNTKVFLQYNVTPRNLLGNLIADQLAAIGAKTGEVSMQDAMNTKWHLALVKRIQARAIVILMATQVKATKKEARPKLPKVRKVTTEGLSLVSSHRFTAISKTLHCYVCLRHSAPTREGRALFLRSPCKVDIEMVDAIFLGSRKPTAMPTHREVQVGRSKLHASHKLNVYRGLYFCAVCGYYAFAKPQKLALPCTERGMAALSRTRRLRDGLLPSGLLRWPNDPDRHGIIQLDDGESM